MVLPKGVSTIVLQPQGQNSIATMVSGLPGYIDEINLLARFEIVVILNITATQRLLQNTKQQQLTGLNITSNMLKSKCNILIGTATERATKVKMTWDD